MSHARSPLATPPPPPAARGVDAVDVAADSTACAQVRIAPRDSAARAVIAPRASASAARRVAAVLLGAALLAAACDDPPPPAATVDGGAPDQTECLPAAPAGAPLSADPACPIARPDHPDTLDEALALAGLDRCKLGFSAKDWSLYPAAIRSDPYRLPFYDAVHDHAVRAPAFARALVARLDAAAASDTPVARALAVAASTLGPELAPCIAPAPPPALAPGEGPLANALARLVTDAGGAADAAKLAAATAAVPLDLQRALADVVRAVAAANAAWLALAQGLSASDLDALGSVGGLAIPSPTYGAPKLSDPPVRDLLQRRFDERALADGAIRLAFAVERARLARFAGAKGFHVDVATPLGRVVVQDAADDTVDDDADHPILLLVDTGGNDTYRYPAGAVDGAADPSARRHVGLHIDLAGDDTYAYVEVPGPRDGKRLPSDADGRYRPVGPLTQDNGPISLSDTPRQGAARLGYGMLFDYGGGRDRYRSLRTSQGFGIAGVGVLFDDGGDDTYEAEAGAQGGAIFGIGLLLDRRGDDTYRTYTMSQGFGFTRGAGVLYDGDGADRYLADVGDPKMGGDPLYFTPQLPGTGNSSFTQGAGFGRRAPGTLADSVYMSGGIGVLRDRAGDDVYTTSVFGQGTGYWFGTGILADGAGDDRYDGKWYVQASAAHFALALFLDDAGDDRYDQSVIPAATSIGVGHDFSVAWHIDGGGDDRYRGPGLSLGSGNANGIGVLLNLGGSDEYRAAGEPALGCGNLSGEVNGDAARRQRPTVGLFVHTGGASIYDVPGSPVKRGHDATWIDVREPPESGPSGEHGAGVDRSTGGVSLP